MSGTQLGGKKVKKRALIWAAGGTAAFLVSVPGLALMTVAVLVGIIISSASGGSVATAMAASGQDDSNVDCTVTVGQTGAAVDSTQPATESSALTSSSTSSPGAATSAAPGTTSIQGGTYASITLTADQMKVAATITSTAETMGLTQRAARIGLAVAYQESKFDPTAVNGPYIGIFQQGSDPQTGLYTDYDRTDPAGAAHMFFDQLVKRVPDYDTDPRPDWEVGEVVQESGVGRNVEPWQPLAQALVSTLWGSSTGGAVYGPVDCSTAGGGANAAFDAGNIISDQVMYDTKAMTVDQIREFIDKQGADCTGDWCLRIHKWTTESEPADQYCAAYPGGTDQDSATVIYNVSQACGINPQVMLVTLQKESALLNRTDVTASRYDAAWGYACPDTGPGGSANCDAGYSGFFNQGYKMAWQWAKYRVEIPKGSYQYHVGENFILWNVEQSGCGGSEVDIKNVATASLYTYTPYQPNAASVAAYPGEGDKCSSYGNRNFFFLFQKYFGDTGGGAPVGIGVNGVAVKLPNNQYVKPPAVGYVVQAPNEAVAKGLAAGLAMLGTPYVWGGGGSGSGPNDGCARGGNQYNSCMGIIGFDCSGLTAYVMQQAGFGPIPGDSGSQNEGGTPIPFDQALPGDIIHFPGHVAVYLGKVNGQVIILEASWVGIPVHVVPLTRTDYSPMVRRYWH